MQSELYVNSNEKLEMICFAKQCAKNWSPTEIDRWTSGFKAYFGSVVLIVCIFGGLSHFDIFVKVISTFFCFVRPKGD